MTSPHLLAFTSDAVCVAEEFGVAFYAPKTLKKFRVERLNGRRIAGIYAVVVPNGESHLHVVDVEANWFLISLARIEVMSSSTIELRGERGVHSEESALSLSEREGLLEAHFHEAGGVLHCVVLTRRGVYEACLKDTNRIVADNIISLPAGAKNCCVALGKTSGLVIVYGRGGKWSQYSHYEERKPEHVKQLDLNINIQSVAVSPVSRRVAVGGTRGELVVYPSDPQDKYFSDHWHHTPLTALSFSVDGNSLYSGAREAMMLVWNMSSFAHKKIRCGLGPIKCIITPTHRASQVLLACADSTLATLDLLQMQVEKFIEGVQWSTDECCSGLVVGRWQGQPAVILTGLPNVVRVCDPFTQQAIYSLHISSQMETIPSPPRYGIQYVGLLNNNRTLVTYEEFCGVSLPPLLRFWVFVPALKRHQESLTICSPHNSGILALRTDETYQRVFTLSTDSMKCWAQLDEDLNYIHAVGRKTWGNQSSSKTPSLLVEDLILSNDGSLCFVSDDNVHVYSTASLHPGQAWQRILTLTQNSSHAPLRNLTLLHECQVLVASDHERVYFWSLASPQSHATTWKAEENDGVTALCGFSAKSVLVATESGGMWELGALDANGAGRVLGHIPDASPHRINFMKSLSLPQQPDRVAVVDSVSGFRVLHVAMEEAKQVRVEQFQGDASMKARAAYDERERHMLLRSFFHDAPQRAGSPNGLNEGDASGSIDRALKVADAQKWLAGVLADSAYTAPPMSTLLSSYLQKRAGVSTF
uniref:Uncharacterized protein TCIL3000_11_8810 n=1 Tax=Trypanosoma congolense (strain IL3000) TaxID=1068625 RepID=G0V1A4_TRYCI|nr:unnamed protein product [Trypanosoma congolense IL3000]